MSVEFEDESQRLVERCEFVVVQASDELAETFWRDSRGLFDEDLGLLVVDRDRRSKYTRW